MSDTKYLNEVIVDELFIIYVNNENITDKIKMADSGPTVILMVGVNGVGKTTTSINLAAALGKEHKKTLLIDLDPQGNASTGLGYNNGDFKNDIYSVLIGECAIEEAIIKTKFKNLSLIPFFQHDEPVKHVFVIHVVLSR